MSEQTIQFWQAMGILTQAVALLLLVGLTAWYTRETRKIAVESRRQLSFEGENRKRSVRHQLHAYLAYLGPKSDRLKLVVENLGPGIALDGEVILETGAGRSLLTFLRLFPAGLGIEPWQYHREVSDQFPFDITEAQTTLCCYDIEGTLYSRQHHRPTGGWLEFKDEMHEVHQDNPSYYG